MGIQEFIKYTRFQIQRWLDTTQKRNIIIIMFALYTCWKGIHTDNTVHTNTHTHIQREGIIMLVPSGKGLIK